MRIHRHPSFRELNRLADRELEETRLHEIHAHLGECQRCRDQVTLLRDLGAAAREISHPSPPDDALAQILARRATGDRVILPAAASLRSAKRRRAVGIAAGIGGALLAATLLLLPANEASAGASDLRFDPAEPEPGEWIEVTYVPTAELAAEDVLYLRGAWRSPGDPGPRGGLPGAKRVELHPTEDGTYAGSVRMPSDAVFGYFAVENPDASAVDAKEGRFWPILAHEDGVPTREALREQLQVIQPTDVEFGLRAAGMLVAAYPDDLVGLRRSLAYESKIAVGQDEERLYQSHRAKLGKLSALLEQDSARWGSDAEDLWWFARQAADTELADSWRQKLLDANYPIGTEMRLAAVMPETNPAERLRIYESVWMRAGLMDDYVVGRAFTYATRIGDAEAVLRWGRRHSRIRPDEIGTVADGFAQIPELRGHAKERIRSDLLLLETRPDERRGLVETRPEFEAGEAQLRLELYRNLGRLLLEDRDYEAAIDTLEFAAAGWDSDAFLLLAEAYLATGDESESLSLFAYAVAAELDLSVRDELDASVRRRLAIEGAEEADWLRRLREAQNSIAQRVREHASTPFRPAGNPEVGDREGVRVPLDSLFDGEVTVVLFWAGHPAAFSQDPDVSLDDLGSLAARGIRLTTITENTPGADLDMELADSKFEFDVYYDQRFEAARSLQVIGVPYLYVVDQQGRFYYTENLEKAIRLAESLKRTALAA